MRRLIAVLAAALMAPALASATPASAQAAPIDPAAAVKKHVGKNRGVTVSELSRSTLDSKTVLVERFNGKYQFGKSGIAASDYVQSARFTKSFLGELTEESEGEGEPFKALLDFLATPKRFVTVKGRGYLNGEPFADVMPAGKKWIRLEGSASPVAHTQKIDVFEGDTLKGLLGKAVRRSPGGKLDGVPTTLYRGRTTYGELYRLSPSFREELGARPTGKAKKTPLTWRIWVDGKGLPRRVVSLVTEPGLDGSGTFRTATDTRYSDWGSRLLIKAPPKGEVTDWDDLEDPAIPDFPDIPTEFNPLK